MTQYLDDLKDHIKMSYFQVLNEMFLLVKVHVVMPTRTARQVSAAPVDTVRTSVNGNLPSVSAVSFRTEASSIP